MKKLVYNNRKFNQDGLCREYGISVGTFRARIAKGMSIDEALQKNFVVKCCICGKSFEAQRPNIKYCSTTCKNRGGKGKGTYKEYTRECVVCHKLFTTDKGYQTKTCSKHCRDQLTRIDRNRRYNKLKRDGKFDASVTLKNVFDRFDGVCVCCNKHLSFECDCNSNDYPSIDHITPLSKGGGHTWDNVQLLCRGCNIKKSNKL